MSTPSGMTTNDPQFIARSIVCPDCDERIEWMRPPTLATMIDGLARHARTVHGMDVFYADTT